MPAIDSTPPDGPERGDNDPGYELVDEIDGRGPAVNRISPLSEHLGWVVRGMLVLFALGFATIFAVAIWLDPYTNDGSPRTMATHTQLGLPPCNMVQMTGKPCPACGMTTSFSLLMHGDPLASMRANWAGTLIALFWLAVIPWAAASAIRGKYYWIRSGEMLITVAVIGMLILMLGRWAALWIM